MTPLLLQVGSGTRGVLYVNDIFGLGQGRHTLYCDELAKLGYHVLAPDYWRGVPRAGIGRRSA